MELIPGLPDDVARECLVRVSHRDFPQIASTCKDWRAEIRLPEFSRRRRTVGSSQTLIIFAQAKVQPKSNSDKFPAPPSYRLTAFDPISGEWSELSPGIGIADSLPMFSQIARVGSELMVIGGWDPKTWTASNAVFLYDFVTATWRRGKDMPGAPRSLFACAGDGSRRVFVAGGHDGEKNALRSAMAYDAATDDWSEMPEMSSGRDECKGIFRNDKFVVVGGYATESQGRFGSGSEAFDPATWRWEAPLEGTCEGDPRTCVVGPEGSVFVCRGGEVLGREETGEGGGAWRRVGEIPAEAREAACAVAWRGGVAVIGSPGFGGSRYSAYLLDTLKSSWTKIDVPEDFTGHVQSGCSFEL